MGKRTVKVPLNVISANESSYGTRTRSRRTPPSGGKENGTPVGTSRWGVDSASSTPKEHHVETTRSSSEHQQDKSSKKRARLAATGPSRSRLCQGENNSRREDSIVGTQSGALVLLSKDLSPDDNNRVKNLQIAPNADNCSLSGDSKQSGAAVGRPVEHDPLSRRPSERRRGSCSFDQNTVTVEVAVTARALVPTEKGPLEKPGRRHIVSHTPSQSGNKVSTKPNGRKVVVDGTSHSGQIPLDACGTSRVAAKPHSRDQHQSAESTRFGKTADLQATVVRATDAWQNAYNKLYKKYQRLKTRQVVDVEGAFDEQSRRTGKFSTAAEDHVQSLRTTISKYEEDMRNRARLIEAAHIDWQKDLDIQRAKNLELQQELKKTEHFGNKLMHDLLQNMTQLSVSNYGKSEIIFSHDESGFEFKLEQNKISEEVGGKDALLYKVVAPGTLLHVAPEWMLSDIVFDIIQVKVFFRRVLAVAVADCRGV